MAIKLVSFSIDDRIHRRLKSHSAKRKVTMSKIVSDLIQKELERSSNRKPIQKRTK